MQTSDCVSVCGVNLNWSIFPPYLFFVAWKQKASESLWEMTDKLGIMWSKWRGLLQISFTLLADRNLKPAYITVKPIACIFFPQHESGWLVGDGDTRPPQRLSSKLCYIPFIFVFEPVFTSLSPGGSLVGEGPSRVVEMEPFLISLCDPFPFIHPFFPTPLHEGSGCLILAHRGFNQITN